MPVAAQTRLYHPALAGTPPEEGNWNHFGRWFPTRLYHLGGLFQTPLYHLHPCRRASVQAGLRRNDGMGDSNFCGQPWMSSVACSRCNETNDSLLAL